MDSATPARADAKRGRAIPAVCAQSGLILKRQSQIRFTLMTVSGGVEIEAIRGYSTATESWVCPVREQAQSV
jgi:hypothetical protein